MVTNNKQSGFTLIELLVVIAIIGLLSSVVLASINSARERSRDSRRLADMQQIHRALEMYYSDYGEYPCEDVSKCDHNSDPANGRIGKGDTIDQLLAPYMNGDVPHDPLGPNDPTHYYFYDSNHCNSKGSGQIVTLSFNEAEASDNIRRDTTCGSEGNIDEADYVIKVGPAPE